MKSFKSLKYATIIFLGLVLLSSGVLGQKHPKELPQPEPLKFKPPKPVEFTLKNGIHAFYLEDRELPLVYIIGLLKCGSFYEPAEKTGLASLTGTVLRTGGTKTKTGDDINEELEFLGATIESSISSEVGLISANCMKKDFKKVLELYADIVMNPEFRQDKIDLAKNQSNESIRRRWDMPMQAASVLFNEKAFGADYPLGRRMTPKSLSLITRQDLIDFHKQYFAPNNMFIGICGDVSLAEAKATLENAFRNWRKRDVKFPGVPALAEKADGTIYYAYKDTPQANIFLGHLGVRRLNPDEYKIEIMNYTLGGGGFTARLMKELRSNRGLTYGIYGGVYEGKDRGLFMISSPLKVDKAVEALGLIKDIIKGIQENPVTDEEITEAKNYIVNSFVFNYQTKNRILSQYISLKLFGYPSDYLDKYIDNIQKVTKEDVQTVAKKYMDLEKMIVLVVGDEKRFDKPLSAFGKVTTIDLAKIMAEERGEQK